MGNHPNDFIYVIKEVFGSSFLKKCKIDPIPKFLFKRKNVNSDYYDKNKKITPTKEWFVRRSPQLTEGVNKFIPV